MTENQRIKEAMRRVVEKETNKFISKCRGFQAFAESYSTVGRFGNIQHKLDDICESLTGRLHDLNQASDI